MSSVQEIEAAIVLLPSKEQEEIYSWLDERFAGAVDARLEHALQSGGLDDRISQALADREAGKARTL